MAASRVVLRSRYLFSRGITASRVSRPELPFISTICLQRHITSSARSWQDNVQNPTTGPKISLADSRIEPTGSHARSIALLKLPRRAIKSDIEALLRSKGYDVKRIQLRLDRFTFQNDTMCFVELGSENQVSEAVKDLNESHFLSETIFARPMNADFVWSREFGQSQELGGSRYFYEEDTRPHDAVKPLLEGRRMMLSVQTPGWGKTDMNVSTRNKTALSIIDQYFGKYGIETVGGLHPFYGDKKDNPRMLCFLDFKTKNGADQAAAELHDTDIEGRKTWLQTSEPAPWRAHQIGKVDKALLTELQEKGIAPQETYEDKFVTPISDRTARKRKSKVSPKMV